MVMKLRRYICVRHASDTGLTLGWCGTVHRFEDRAEIECRRFNSEFHNDHWDVHDSSELPNLLADHERGGEVQGV